MKKIMITLVAMLLAGCENERENADFAVTDQCINVALFEKCMRLLPAGPQSTQYNDWDEVVESCRYAAVTQSQRMRRMVKPECRYGGKYN